jgi:anti-sigma factor RsiW
MGLRHLSDAELTEWAEGEAGATRLPAIEAHLLACQRCSLAVQRIREAAELVERLSAETAPVGLRARAAASYLAEAQAPIACEEAAPLLQEHIDRCLSPGAALMLGPHLDSCRQCRAELATLEATTRALRELPTVESPARVRESILEAQRPAAGSAPFVLRWKPALAAACAVLVVIAIAAVRPASRPVPQPEVVLSAEQPSAGAPSRVEVARVDGDSGRSVSDHSRAGRGHSRGQGARAGGGDA